MQTTALPSPRKSCCCVFPCIPPVRDDTTFLPPLCLSSCRPTRPHSCTETVHACVSVKFTATKTWARVLGCCFPDSSLASDIKDNISNTHIPFLPSPRSLAFLPPKLPLRLCHGPCLRCPTHRHCCPPALPRGLFSLAYPVVPGSHPSRVFQSRSMASRLPG